MMFTPTWTRSRASSHTRARARRSPSGPSSIGHVMSSVRASKTSWATWRSVSSSWLRRIGWLRTSWWACSGVSSSRLRSVPRLVRRLITISSRIESIGGLVTWANSCLK